MHAILDKRNDKNRSLNYFSPIFEQRIGESTIEFVVYTYGSYQFNSKVAKEIVRRWFREWSITSFFWIMCIHAIQDYRDWYID